MLEIDQPQATVERVDPSRRLAAAMRVTLAALLTICLFADSAAAGPFSELVVFGDSLSDVGNIAQASFDIYPGQYYFNDRFSNGPVYVESLATGLGLPPTVRSQAGGNNFAYGGARTSGTPGFEGLFIRDIDEQVDTYLASRTTDSNALFIVFSGANDLVGGVTNVNIPVNNLAEDIGRLIADGAQNFLVMNLPWLGETPRFRGNPTNRQTYNARTQQFNASLDAVLDGLEASNQALTIFRFDVATLFNEAIANPSSYGLTNVVSPAAPGLQPGASSYNTGQIAANAHQYLFWDDLHPTATVHAILAQRALAELAKGDFNWDGVVDAADYIVWRKRQGATYPTSDYAAWRQYFGESGGGGGFATGSTLGPMVPEPASAILLLVAAVAISMSRRKNASSRG